MRSTKTTQPEHVGTALDTLLKKLEAKRNEWKAQQAEDEWMIARANEMNDWYLEVFGDAHEQQNRKYT